MGVLNDIGVKTKTDKCNAPGYGHGYLDFYERYLPARDEKILLLEIGIGGYQYPDRGGESLRMWNEYYTNPETLIVGFDLFLKSNSLVPSEKVKMFFAPQNDSALAQSFADSYGSPDVIIDDASHRNDLSIETFDLYFGLLKPGGVYIWEDIHTSFWPGEYQGIPEPMQPGTALHTLARLMYGLQVDSMEIQYREKWDGHISEMHFMRNTCVIVKKK